MAMLLIVKVTFVTDEEELEGRSCVHELVSVSREAKSCEHMHKACAL